VTPYFNARRSVDTVYTSAYHPNVSRRTRSTNPLPPNPSNATGGLGIVHFHDEGPHLATVINFPIAVGWVAQANVIIDPGDRRLVIANLFIHPPQTLKGLEGSPESDLTSAVLRAVKTSRILSRVYEELHAQPGLSAAWEEFLKEPVPEWRHKAEKRATSELEAGVVKRGPTGRPDIHFRKVASLYLDLYAAGWGRGILAEIQKRLKANSREQARDWVHGATTRGFLSPGTPGVAGRLPGAELDGYTPKRVAAPPSKKPASQR